MTAQKKLLIGIALVLVTTFAISIAWAAPEDNRPAAPETRQRPGTRRPGGPQQRGNFQERMLTMLKQRLNASDENWKTIEPQLTKVMTLSRQAGPRPMGSMGAMMGRGQRPQRGQRPERDQRPQRGQESTRPDRRGAPQQGEKPDAPKNDVQKTTEALQKSLQTQEPDTEDIKAKLLALRNARKKAKTELTKAQKELQKVLTIDQEAKLVLAGIIE